MRKRSLLVGLMLAACFCLIGGTAQAQHDPQQDSGNLATIILSHNHGKPGDVITVRGDAFQPGGPSVFLYLRGNPNPLLGPVTVDRAGVIKLSLTMPEGAPGYYILEARQQDARGISAYGTPALASFQILGDNGQSVVIPPVSPTDSTLAPSPSSAGIIGLTVGLAILGLALYGAGFVAFVRSAMSADYLTATRK